jgi:hypothetical protein
MRVSDQLARILVWMRTEQERLAKPRLRLGQHCRWLVDLDWAGLPRGGARLRKPVGATRSKNLGPQLAWLLPESSERFERVRLANRPVRIS